MFNKSGTRVPLLTAGDGRDSPHAFDVTPELEQEPYQLVNTCKPGVFSTAGWHESMRSTLFVVELLAGEQSLL
jgi:hypothetical protein